MDNNRFKKSSRFKEIVRLFLKNKPALVGLIGMLIIIIVAIFADLIVDEELCYACVNVPFEAPSAEHPFGTDNLGRDLFARVVHGARYSLAMGFGATALSLAVGALIGAACGFFGGWFDNVVMRIFDVIASIPGMLLIMTLVMVFGVSTQNLLLALMISGVPGYARFVRATVIGLSDTDYVQCARSFGAGNLTIILRHVLPNALGPIIITFTNSISGMILAAAGYSFLGFGVQPPTPEWGAIISSSRQFMRIAPHYTLIPGFAIVITAMCINLAGDGLRDALDPKLKD